MNMYDSANVRYARGPTNPRRRWRLGRGRRRESYVAENSTNFDFIAVPRNHSLASSRNPTDFEERYHETYITNSAYRLILLTDKQDSCPFSWPCHFRDKSIIIKQCITLKLDLWRTKKPELAENEPGKHDTWVISRGPVTLIILLQSHW